MLLQVLSSDASYDVLLPIALRYLSSGPAVLRAPAADAVVALMRAVQKPYQRTEILCRLLREYAQGRSCYKRLAFLDAAAAMLQRYSVRYKKDSPFIHSWHALQSMVTCANGSSTEPHQQAGILCRLLEVYAHGHPCYKAWHT